jgi:hypothetical protein
VSTSAEQKADALSNEGAMVKREKEAIMFGKNAMQTVLNFTAYAAVTIIVGLVVVQTVGAIA